MVTLVLLQLYMDYLCELIDSRRSSDNTCKKQGRSVTNVKLLHIETYLAK